MIQKLFLYVFFVCSLSAWAEKIDSRHLWVYYANNQVQGYLLDLKNGGDWVETIGDQEVFRFREDYRDDSHVLLYDSSRHLYVALTENDLRVAPDKFTPMTVVHRGGWDYRRVLFARASTGFYTLAMHGKKVWTIVVDNPATNFHYSTTMTEIQRDIGGVQLYATTDVGIGYRYIVNNDGKIFRVLEGRTAQITDGGNWADSVPYVINR